MRPERANNNPTDADVREPFWRRKSLAEMTRAEWESLCDGCGRCCLEKLQEGRGGAFSFTNVACRILDTDTCRCKHYQQRRRYVANCEQLTPQNVGKFSWLPVTCAYRRLHEGRTLPWWHPLVSGDPELVHAVGVSVRGKAVPEQEAGPLEHHLVEWPGEEPEECRER